MRPLTLLCCALVVWLAALTTPAVRAEEPPALPSFAELEAAGARIGEIRVITHNIFDTEDPRENYLLFRWANALHIRTQPHVVRRLLLFHSGEPISARLIEETERLLRKQRYLYDVALRPVAVHDGVVDIEVMTHDTWSLDISASAGRAGGENTSSLGISEFNLLGTGIAVGYARSNDPDRSGNEFLVSDEHAFDGWTNVSLSLAKNSDGRRDAISAIRPFYALDTRWAAGATGLDEDRIDSVYNAGEIVSQYRHEQRRGEVYYGLSRGLIDGWARRASVGFTLQDNRYLTEPGRIAPPQLPTDEKLVGPFVRFELVEERYQRLENRNVMGEPEFFALGLASTVQLGWASKALGSSHDALLYAGTISRGFEPAPQQTLQTSAAISGQLVDGRIYRQQLGGELHYYLPHSRRALFYTAASVDMLTNPDVLDMLLLGGDNGLRGYPLRYQSGTRRALFTVEERVYSDWYLWRLFRIGGAAFADMGRAWGGGNVNTVNPGWLGDVGIGLRIVSTRAAFSNVLHIDLAFPLQATGDIEKVQLLVKAKASF